MRKIRALIMAVAMVLGLVGVASAVSVTPASAQLSNCPFDTDPGKKYVGVYCQTYSGWGENQVRVKIACAAPSGSGLVYVNSAYVYVNIWTYASCPYGKYRVSTALLPLGYRAEFRQV
jgi:hypothetical protein